MKIRRGILPLSLLCLSFFATAEDILLLETHPIPNDERMVVATYLHNAPNWYYFTMIYQSIPFDKFLTKITFDNKHADIVHKVFEKLLIRIYSRSSGVMGLLSEEREVVPFVPPALIPEEEVYIIYPNRG